ncbi:hypothetical protein BX600DRAFT_257795 [Xylariales sp. PMI_506]|nr:hypothetical protein BX600DRAFT_257795 [Xylariales sp. PMI_506]
MNVLLETYEQFGMVMPPSISADSDFLKRSGLQKCVVLIYSDIVDFHSGAYQCFTQFPDKVRKRVFKTAWRDFGRCIRALENSMRAHQRLVEALDPSTIGTPQAQLTSRDFWKFNREVSAHEKDCVERFGEFHQEEAKKQGEQFDIVLGWLSNSVDTTHSDRCLARESHPETCEWIMDHDAVKNWMQASDPTHSILWINGIMGSGKSTLVSYLIEKCMSHSWVDKKFSTVYFYCRGDNSELSTALAVFRGLLRQQLINLRGKSEYMHLVSYFQEKRGSCSAPNLDSLGVAEQLLSVFLETFPSQYIIIDGLDECKIEGQAKKSEAEQCLSLLTKIVAQQENSGPGGLRLLITSRDIPEIRKSLSSEKATANILTIKPTDNVKAIETYVWQRLERFPEKLNLTKEEKERIRDLTCYRAKDPKGDLVPQGMFLFAELVLNNLQDACNKEGLLQELDSQVFPQNLEQAYNKLLESLRNRLPELRWEKAIAIFGWLICAGRTLRWHEIQAIICMVLEEQDVDYANKKLIVDVQELCGSLVHVQPGNKVELIHHTASRYILNSKRVDKVKVEFDLALLCMKYLTFSCFVPEIIDENGEEFARRGLYAFQDYAVSKWFYHIGTLVGLSDKLLSVDAAKAREFADVLDHFTSQYIDSIEDHCTSQGQEDDDDAKAVEKDAVERCKGVEGAAYHAILLNLWIHISKHEKKPIKERNKVSLPELDKTLCKTRKIIEQLSVESNPEEGRRLEELYGHNVFKCPWTKCDYFYEGFRTGKEREVHINRHNRPFECPVAGCNMGGAGFISSKDLEKHKKNYHMGLMEGSSPFPNLNKKKRDESKATFECEVCGQCFTRKINMKSHTLAHFGERPYSCQRCGRSFTRKNDLKRHEKLHQRR